MIEPALQPAASPVVTWLHRAIIAAMLLVAIPFAVLRFVDLEADFPIVVTSSGAMYTDEGIYARNALARELTGNWYITGEYNTAINYPVYTLMQVAAFNVFGCSLATLRGISAFSGLLAVGFIALLMHRRFGIRAAAIAAAMLLMNYRHLVYSRFGNMDVPTTLFICAGLCALLWNPAPLKARQVILCGIAMFLGLLVKTSVLAGAAAAGFVILTHEANWRRRIAMAGVYVGTLIACAGLYFLAVLLPNWTDFRSVSGDVIDSRLTTSVKIYWDMLYKILWSTRKHVDWYFAPLALAFGPLLAIAIKPFRRDPLFVAGVAWLVLHFLMMAFIQYDPPRYYAPAVVPTFIVVTIMIERALLAIPHARQRGLVPLAAVSLSLLALVLLTGEQLCENVKQARGYFGDRKHTLVDSAAAMKQVIEADKLPRVFVISHSAATPLFVMRYESIGEHLGPASRREKITTHRPTHFIQHVGNDAPDAPDETVDAFRELGYRLELMGTYRMLRDEMDDRTMRLFRAVPPK